jgi:CcmD family protein
MGNSIYLFAAYGTLWLIIFIYVFQLFRSQQTLKNQLDNIEKMLRRNRDFDGGKP